MYEGIVNCTGYSCYRTVLRTVDAFQYYYPDRTPMHFVCCCGSCDGRRHFGRLGLRMNQSHHSNTTSVDDPVVKSGLFGAFYGVTGNKGIHAMK